MKAGKRRGTPLLKTVGLTWAARHAHGCDNGRLLARNAIPAMPTVGAVSSRFSRRFPAHLLLPSQKMGECLKRHSPIPAYLSRLLVSFVKKGLMLRGGREYYAESYIG